MHLTRPIGQNGLPYSPKSKALPKGDIKVVSQPINNLINYAGKRETVCDDRLLGINP